jgi:hypothetical protein
MDLELPIFEVFIAPPGTDAETAIDTGSYELHRVTVLHADQLRAEITGARLTGVQRVTDAPMTYTTLWCWLAMGRNDKDLAGPSFEDFRSRVVQVRKAEENVTVDPTHPGVPMPSDLP